MPTYNIPGHGKLCLSVLVLDLNGTVSVDGQVVAGVRERVAALKILGMEGYLLTADTRRHGQQTADDLGLALHRLAANDKEDRSEGTQKRAFVERLGAERVAAVGNGANDSQMLQAAALGIVVIQAEGAASATLYAGDVVVSHVCDALDLLLNPARLIATLRC